MAVLRQVTADSCVRRWEIGLPEHGKRLDRFLAERIPELSRSRIQKILRERVWTSTKENVSCSTRLQAGEVVFARFPYPQERFSPYEVEVLFEDEHLLAVNKPAGVLVHPTPKERVNSLIMVLRHSRGAGYLTLVHRLDRETSGVLLLAKTPQAAKECGEKLYYKEMQKTYVARVAGHLPEDSGEIDFAIGDAHWSKVYIRRGVVDGGQEATTRYRVLCKERSTSIVELAPLTGRNHQLRVHMEALGCPIVGDQLYGKKDEHFLAMIDGDFSPIRLHLHAWKLSGDVLGRKLCLESSLPEIFIKPFNQGGLVRRAWVRS
jgi:23S rRNA pseudouridine1911/1915/1917 synthase